MGAAAIQRPSLNVSAWALLGLATLLSAAYVFVLQDTPESLLRSGVKTASVALFALLVLIERGPRLLVIGLAFGALGDWFMSLDGPRWFPFGLGAFLVGHLFYIALFLRNGLGAAALRSPVRLIAALAIVGGGVATLINSREYLGAFFELAAIYTAVISLMTLAALTLPFAHWIAIVGAVLFLISDGLLTMEMFQSKTLGSNFELIQFLAWATYWGGQLGICVGGLGLKR